MLTYDWAYMYTKPGYTLVIFGQEFTFPILRAELLPGVSLIIY
jgi:hypothetical protein